MLPVESTNEKLPEWTNKNQVCKREQLAWSQLFLDVIKRVIFTNFYSSLFTFFLSISGLFGVIVIMPGFQVCGFVVEQPAIGFKSKMVLLLFGGLGGKDEEASVDSR